MVIIGYGAAVVVFLAVYWALSTVFERPEDKKYPAVSFIRQLGGREEQGVYRIFKPLLLLAKSVYRDEEKRKTLLDEIRMAGMQTTPEEILAAQVLLGTLAFLAVYTGGRLGNNELLCAAAPVAAVIAFFQPRTMLKNKAKARKNAIRAELPDFIDVLLLLTEAGFNPYLALREASGYVGGTLGPEVKLLVAEMDAAYDELQALRSFADRLDIPELKSFVAAFSQALTTDSARAREIYAQQAAYMREMRVANLRKLIKELPAKMKGYNLLLFLISIAVSLIPLVIMFARMKLPT